jgi:hypothetical protein
MRLVHQPVQTAGTIEQGILGVQMKTNKVRVRHEDSLTSDCQDTKPQSFENYPHESFSRRVKGKSG